MRTLRKLLIAGIAAGALLIAPVAIIAWPQAEAVDGCATRGEYDNLIWGLSDEQVRNRFETNGWFIGSGDDFWKRGYDACWDNDRKVVIWYAFDNGLTDHWDIRDK